jgi:hypothetical protein
MIAGLNDPPFCAVEAIDVLCFRAGFNLPRGACCEVDVAEIPQPFRSLLDHPNSFAETLERHYGGAIELHVIDVVRRDEQYARKVFFTPQGKDTILGYGVMKLRLDHAPGNVAKIVCQETCPFGQVLLRERIVAHYRADWFMRFDRGSGYLKWFGTRLKEPVFGRLCAVECEGRPLAEMFGIVTGVHPEGQKLHLD